MYSNCRVLAGRTLFITGASRGIGKAIAIKAARDGANIVIAAKTAESHSKLPGTIYTAAKEGMYVCSVSTLLCTQCIYEIQQKYTMYLQAFSSFCNVICDTTLCLSLKSFFSSFVC